MTLLTDTVHLKRFNVVFSTNFPHISHNFNTFYRILSLLLNRSKVLFSFTAGPKTSLLHLKTESSMTITSIFTRLAANFNSF